MNAVVQLLRHGSDPLLYDYSGNMPIDLARESENDRLLEYFSAILADLHGKPARRWNVSHDRTFVLPQAKELDLPSSSSIGQDNDDDDSDFEPLFQVTSQPLPPQYMLPVQHPGDKFVLVTDLKRFNIDVGKSSSRLSTVRIPHDEFVKSAHCCLLGATVDLKKGPAAAADPVVTLVKVDAHLNKALGIDEPKLLHSVSLSSGSKRKQSS